MQTKVIRKMCLSDIESVGKLENQYGKEIYSLDALKKIFEYDYYYNLVLEIDDKIVGYIMTTIICDECEILKIIVDEKYRRQGLGELLLQNLIDYCKQNSVSKIFLEVRSQNCVAKKLYQKIGFEKTGIRDNYYGDDVAEIYWYQLNG